MTLVKLLRENWQDTLSYVIKSASRELVISSPFVTQEGVNFVLSNLQASFAHQGNLIFVTNLSPLNLIQGSTDLHSLRELTVQLSSVDIFHLPRLHAKAYIANADKAIITSGNLTHGGLRQNYEYGVLIEETDLVLEAYVDIIDYASLGAKIGAAELIKYCSAADEAKAAYRSQQTSITRTAKLHFEQALQAVNDELIRYQLAEGPIHSVFEKTIVYLLKKHGELITEELHPLVKEIHPDLCDDTVDRVIDGRSFGKKWKHAVRTAQQHLRKKGVIRLIDGQWALLDQNAL